MISLALLLTGCAKVSHLDQLLTLKDLAGEGVVISKEFLNGLSPYRNSNINRFGDYNLDLERDVAPSDCGIKILEQEET